MYEYNNDTLLPQGGQSRWQNLLKSRKIANFSIDSFILF